MNKLIINSVSPTDLTTVVILYLQSGQKPHPTSALFNHSQELQAFDGSGW